MKTAMNSNAVASALLWILELFRPCRRVAATHLLGFWVAASGLAQSFSYETLTPASSPASFVSQANAEGARGYKWMTTYGFGGEFVAVYVKDSSQSAAFSYETLTPASSPASFVSQANAEGARGYKWMTTYGFGGEFVAVYVKDSSQSAAFSYETLTPASSPASFVSQANAEGARGYKWMTTYGFGGEFVAVYVKDSSQSAAFSYETLTPASSPASFVSQANAEGARGYEWMTTYGFGGEFVAVYVKDSSQSAAVGYKTLIPASTPAAFVSQANAEGAKGNTFITDYSFGGGSSIVSIYVGPPSLPPPCTYILSHNEAKCSSSGDSGSFAVYTSDDCAWQALSIASWIHPSGGGDIGVAYYQVDANYTSAFRNGTITAGGQSFIVIQGPRGFAWDNIFGWTFDAGGGWVHHDGFGWMWFSPSQWIWSSSVKGWVATTGSESRTLWSTQFRWLTPSATDAFKADTTSIGVIYIGKYNGAAIPDSWVVSERFGYIWANGEGVWFYSTTYGWLGVTPEGGIWCVNQGRFL
jgi:hypothetical protein